MHAHVKAAQQTHVCDWTFIMLFTLSISWWSPELIILPQNTYRWNLVVAWKKKLYLGQLNTVNEELYLMRTIKAHIQAASTKHNTVRLLFFYFAIWADHQLMIPRTNNFTIELHTDEPEWASCNAAPSILPKSWWAYAHPAHSLPSSLLFELGISWWSPGLIIVP